MIKLYRKIINIENFRNYTSVLNYIDYILLRKTNSDENVVEKNVTCTRTPFIKYLYKYSLS